MGSAAVVLQREPDLFPAAYFNARRLKELLVPFLTHPHFDNAGGLLWIARLAGGKSAMVVALVRQSRHWNNDHGYGRARCCNEPRR
jgi:glyoxylase-like metal-dependent hydrolase (beta-lactamase superfamily II)